MRRVASGERTFRFDEVREWPRERFEHLVQWGILREGPLAGSVDCDACGKMHREDVLWEPSVRDLLGKRAYIRCPEEGPVHVPEIRLRQWVIDGGVMAEKLAAAMALSGEVEEILAGTVWKLGRRRLAARFRDVFMSMAATGDHLKIADLAARHLAAKDGILLVAQPPHKQDGLDRLTVIDLAQVVELGTDGLVLDLDYIEDGLPSDRAIKENKIRSLPTPEGIAWPEITLEVGESSLRVLARGQSWDVDLEAAGFADSRRKHGEADKLFQILLWFALHHGRLPLDEVTRRKDSPDGFRRQISNLRKRLGNLIPAEGESIRWDAEEEAYTCCFKILRSGEVTLPQPAGGSWMSFEFIERRDGRIAVGVKANSVRRARDVRTGEPGAAEHQETVWHEYSLVDLGLARDVNRLLEEGHTLIELLRSGGRLVRPGDDLAALKLNQWLRDRSGLGGDQAERRPPGDDRAATQPRADRVMTRQELVEKIVRAIAEMEGFYLTAAQAKARRIANPTLAQINANPGNIRQWWDKRGPYPTHRGYVDFVARAPSQFVTLRDFYEARTGPTEPFYFYDPFETNPKFSHDPTGQAIAGRYTVRFAGEWTQSVGLGRVDVNLELTELA